MYVCQKDISRTGDSPYFILQMKRNLKIVLPVLSLISVIGEYWVVVKDSQSGKVGFDSFQDDDVRRYHKKVSGKPRILLVQFVKICPRNEQTHHFRLAASGRHFNHEAEPVLREHIRAYSSKFVVLQKVILAFYSGNIKK